MTLDQEDLKSFVVKITAPLTDGFDGEGVMTPMWIIDGDVDGGKRGLTIIATPWADNSEKEASITFVKNKMKELNAIRYVQISEAWTLKSPSKSEIPQSINLGASIASHPDRREAIIAIAEDKRGNHIQMTRYILRPEHDKATLAEAEYMTFDRCEGRMANLLKD